jgi:hypothetical protein
MKVSDRSRLRRLWLQYRLQNLNQFVQMPLEIAHDFFVLDVQRKPRSNPTPVIRCHLKQDVWKPLSLLAEPPGIDDCQFD